MATYNETRQQLHRAIRAIEAERDELREAARAWLTFDHDVERPGPGASYEELINYEYAKMTITERVAAAIKAAEA